MHLRLASVVVVAMAAITNSLAGDHEEPFAGSELASFLGPVSPKLITWHKYDTHDIPGSEYYYGMANPPLSGTVSIMIFLPPWKPDLATMPTPDGPDQLGALHGTWSKGMLNGVYALGFGFAPDTKGRLLKIEISSPKQSDTDQIAKEISHLPMFNGTPETPFQRLEMEQKRHRP
jgi:hypothetical protein